MPNPDESIWVPDPDGSGRVPAVFLEPGEPTEGIEVDGRRRDVAWVLYEEGDRAGTTGMVLYSEIGPRLDMRTFQGPVIGGREQQRMPEVLERIGQAALASRFREAMGSHDFVTALGSAASELAEALEILALRTDVDANLVYAMDLATAIRIEAGGSARRGTPLNWEERGSAGLGATDGRGQFWVLEPRGRSWSVAFGVFEPSWWAGSLESAKALAEEIAVRPNFGNKGVRITRT
jgi:hypothetical protein